MVSIKPYLSVKSALDAINLYKKVFNAELIERVPVEQEQAKGFGVPDDLDLSKTTMHASIKIGDHVIYLADNFSGGVLEHTNVALLIEVDSVEQAEKYFKKAEKNKCNIYAKFEKQFWGDYFGGFKDPFGVNWQVNCTPPKE